MGNLEKYLLGAKRGEFQWECVETTDGIGMGGVLREETHLEGCSASIFKESNNEYVVEVGVKNDPYFYEEYRASRKGARMFAERVIRQDIETSKQNPTLDSQGVQNQKCQ